MDQLETLLRDTLREHAGDAPAGPVALPSRRGSVRTVLGLAAVAALVIALAVVIAVTRPATRALPLGRPLGGPFRYASYGPVSLRVPAGLPTRTSLCGGPVANEVVAQSGELSYCPEVGTSLAPHPGAVVWFAGPHERSPFDAVALHRGVLRGRPVLLGYAIGAPGLGDGLAAEIEIPTEHVRIGVTARNEDEVRSLIDSIRIGAVDPLGCAARVRAVRPEPSGPANRMFPSAPITSVRCAYSARSSMLIGSWRFDHRATTTLVAALDRLRPDPCGTQCTGDLSVLPVPYNALYFTLGDGSRERVLGTTMAGSGVFTNGRWRVAVDGPANHRVDIEQVLTTLARERG